MQVFKPKVHHVNKDYFLSAHLFFSPLNHRHTNLGGGGTHDI